MFSILYQMSYVAFYGTRRSLMYALPLLLFIFTTCVIYLNFKPPLLLALAVVGGFLFLGALYLIAVLTAMLRPQDAFRFIESLRWRRRHWDFLGFSAAAFLLLGVLIVILGDLAHTLHVYSLALESKPTSAAAHDAYGYEQGGRLIFLFGSRLLAGVFLVATFILWIFFFRTGIKVPAYVEGYSLRSDEALDLTRLYRWQITAMSLLVNVPLLAALLAIIPPWEGLAWWFKSLISCAVVWLFLHMNMSLLIGMYWTYTQGYSMQRLRRD